MRITAFATVVTVALIPFAATAQTAPAKPAFALPPESITIVGVKPSEDTIKSFVQTREMRTRIVGKIARWRREVCPLTVGLGDKYAKYVTQRIRDVAKAVGAPVS